VSSRLERITQQRLDKVERLRQSGIDPYPARFKRSHSAQEAANLLVRIEEGLASDDAVSIAGRITAIRNMGKGAFVDLRDGSGKIQLLFQMGEGFNDGLFKELDVGDFIGAGGKILRTRRGEPTVQVEDFNVLSKSLRPLPEKWHGLQDVDMRYRQRYLDLISNPEVKETFKTRGQVISGIRRFLDKQGFLEVETPILQPSAGGAMARPFVTRYQALGEDFFLRIALELHLKRLIIGGFDRVYEIGRTFRNEGLSVKHNPEFTMLECYQAYADYNDVMKMLEKMVSGVAKSVTGGYAVQYGENEINFKPPWPRLKLRQAIIDGCGLDFQEYPDAASLREAMRKLKMDVDPKKDRGRLIDELLSTFVEPKLIQPTFLIDYPLDMSPLAKSRTDDGRLVERFEAYCGGMEIANAFTELNDPVEQRRRFEKQLETRKEHYEEIKMPDKEAEESETIDEDFIQAMEYGMPPTGGLGVGIDRLVMLLTDKHTIREVVFFPQLKGKE
jgi:lysyl-tRNA synthetase class 2